MDLAQVPWRFARDCLYEECEGHQIMHYLLCKHVVEDYAKWRAVFDSHCEAQREAGLHLLHVLREVDDPRLVVMFFKVDDLEKAKAFTQTQGASEAAECSGVIGTPEVLFLSE